MRIPNQPKPSKPIKHRVYKPMRFGEGMLPGTVDWERNKRLLREEEREEERQWAAIQATRNPESETLVARIGSALDRIGVYFARVTGIGR